MSEQDPLAALAAAAKKQAASKSSAQSVRQAIPKSTTAFTRSPLSSAVPRLRAKKRISFLVPLLIGLAFLAVAIPAAVIITFKVLNHDAPDAAKGSIPVHPSSPANTVAGREALAAVQPAKWIPWTVRVPQTNLTVVVQYPSDWKQTKYDSGQPYIYKPGANADEFEATWEFDVKHGVKGRDLQQVLNQIADNTSRYSETAIIKKELVDRPDGTKAGILEYKSTEVGVEATVREYFFLVDADSLLVTSEHAFGSSWKKYAPTLAKITDSIKADSK